MSNVNEDQVRDSLKTYRIASGCEFANLPTIDFPKPFKLWGNAVIRAQAREEMPRRSVCGVIYPT